MLKLEKRKQHITITLQRKERNHHFWTAFLTALTLHLSAFLLIRVTPIVIGNKEIVFSPIRVNAKIPIGTSAIAKTTYPFEPMPPEPILPELEVPPLIHFQEPPYPFTPLPDLSLKEISKPYFIISGPLAKAKIIQTPFPKEHIQGKFFVRVDNQTGKVFWYDDKIPNPTLDAFFEALTFITQDEGLFITGTIEINL